VTTRRRFLRALAACTAVTTVSTYGQLAKKLPRIGVLALSDIPYVNDALRQGLREQGYIEGENIEIVYRSAGGNADRLPALVGQLMELNIDLIVAMGASPARAAKQATSTLPIVMAPVGNPVEGGFVTSLARPGGNITGVSVFSLDLAAKRVALLKELLPRAERFAVLLTTSSSAPTGMMDASRNAARNLGVSVQFISIATSADFDRAFESMKQGRAEGLIIIPSPLFNSERAKLSELALKYRLPVVGEAREFAVAVFVLGYGPSIGDATRRSAVYVDKILKGAPPGELAIEQPAKFEMTINLKAAKALGLTIPPALLLRADEVIQ
jgi:putative tryptophan/tyrosine transport system substrate-binding protein